MDLKLMDIDIMTLIWDGKPLECVLEAYQAHDNVNLCDFALILVYRSLFSRMFQTYLLCL